MTASTGDAVLLEGRRPGAPAALPPWTPDRPPPQRPGRARRRVLGALAVVGVVGSALGIRDALDQVNAGGLPLAARFFSAALEPRLDPAFLGVVGQAALTTVAFAVLGTLLALLIGLLLGPAMAQAGRRTGGRRLARTAPAGRLAARAALALPRGVHEVVWALLLLAVLGLDPLVAVLAIGVPYGAVTAKVVADLLDEAPRQPMIALLAAGATRRQAVLLGLAPAASGDIVAYGFYRFECALRAAAILGIVGAGGLGFELALSFQALRYEEMWTIIAALVVLAAAAEGWSDRVRRRLCARRLELVRPDRPDAAAHVAPAAGPRERPARDRVLSASTTAVVALGAVSAWWVGLDPSSLWSERARMLAGEVLGGAWPPDFAAAGGAGLATEAATTLAIAALGAGLAFALAVVLVVPAAASARLRRSGRRTVTAAVGRALLRAPLLLLRAVPPPVWAFVLLLVLFPGVLAGALAIALYNLGVIGRLLADAVDEVDDGPLRALETLGASHAQIVLHGILPAALSRFAALGLERWEMAIRDTVVVGLVGAGGLGLLLDGQLARFAFDAVAATLIVLLALTFAVDLVGGRLRRALR